MTVAEMFEQLEIKSTFKIMSGYNGKVLCYRFNPDKHVEIGKREISSVWADIVVNGSGYGRNASPIICAYVDGTQEYEIERKKHDKSERKGDC